MSSSTPTQDPVLSTEEKLCLRAVSDQCPGPKLNLSGRCLGDKAMKRLEGILRERRDSLVSVDLSDNWITAVGVRYLTEGLKYCSRLASIDLHRNSIGSEGAVTIAEMLPSTPQLASIDFEGNCIGDRGASILAKALETHAAIRRINLGDNGISDTGACAIADMLKCCSGIQCVYLSANEIRDRGQRALLAAVEGCPSLRVMDVLVNPVSAAGSSCCCLLSWVRGVPIRVERSIHYQESIDEIIRQRNVSMEAGGAELLALRSRR